MPPGLYGVVLKCWSADPRRRPSFSWLCAHFVVLRKVVRALGALDVHLGGDGELTLDGLPWDAAGAVANQPEDAAGVAPGAHDPELAFDPGGAIGGGSYVNLNAGPRAVAAGVAAGSADGHADYATFGTARPAPAAGRPLR